MTKARVPEQQPVGAEAGPPKGPLALRERYSRCFGCGQNNPMGLKLRLHEDEGKAKGEFVPQPHHQGWPPYVHGGILGTLLDEAMAYVPVFLGLFTITARMEIRFVKPAPIAGKLTVEAQATRVTRKLVEANGTAYDEDGNIVATGNATMLVLSESQAQRLGLTG